MARRTRRQWLLPLIYILAFAGLWYTVQRSSNPVQPKQISYSEFLLEVRAGHVSEVGIDEQQFIATLKTDPAKKEPAHANLDATASGHG